MSRSTLPETVEIARERRMAMTPAKSPRRPASRWQNWRRKAMFCGGLLACGLPVIAAWGEGPVKAARYMPLDQTVQPGTAGAWANRMFPDTVGYYQTVRIEVPAGGQVTVYGGPNDPRIEQEGSTLAGLLVGPVYRLKLAAMDEYPGVELYPTIELIDRLHPPPGREAEYPVPVAFTAEELIAASEGRLVTKVIYVEQPDMAAPEQSTDPLPTEYLNVAQNPLEEADFRGRPIAIVRLGGRLPNPSGQEPAFFGSGAPVRLVQAPPAKEVTPLPEPTADEPAGEMPADEAAAPPQSQRARRQLPLTKRLTGEVNR